MIGVACTQKKAKTEGFSYVVTQQFRYSHYIATRDAYIKRSYIMNAKQISAIRRATNLLSKFYTRARLSFTTERLADGSILFAATNIYSDLGLFETSYSFYGIVGPRGGIRKYEGNMSL